MKNKKLWIIFTTAAQIFSWVAPLTYVAIEYGVFLMNNSVVLMFAIGFGIAIWLILKHLKDTAENGYGLFAKVARAIRFVMPLAIITSLVIVINTGLGAFVPVILIFLAGNIIAQPLSVLGYYFGPAYIRDVGINKLVEKE